MSNKSDNKIFENWNITMVDKIKTYAAKNNIPVRVGRLINPFIYDHVSFGTFFEVQENNKYEEFIDLIKNTFMQEYERGQHFADPGSFSNFVEVGQNDKDIVLSYVDPIYGLYTYPIDEDALEEPIDYSEG